MNFWEKVTGSDMTKEFKAFELRVSKLPVDYQNAWNEINTNLLCMEILQVEILCQF